MSATAHELRAATPVLPGEDPSQWELFRGGVVTDLDAVGILEAELADRVALLRRVAAFEVASASGPPPPRPVDIRNEAELMAVFDSAPETLKNDLRQFKGCHADAIRASASLEQVLAGQSVCGTEAMFLLRHAVTFLPGQDGDDEVANGCGADDEQTGTLVDEADFLKGLGIPERQFDNPEGWTPAVVRTVLPSWPGSRGGRRNGS